MAPLSRLLSFGSAAALVVAGTVCVVLADGAEDAVGIGLITLGLGAALLLVFLEVGLSEDRELAREEKRRLRAAGTDRRRLRPRRLPRRPG